jgi:Domain of unknown function (DUF4262)
MEEQNHIDHNEQAEKTIIHNVKTYGFHIAFIEADDYLPAFAYTIGLYKTYNHPEIIVFGLKQEVMNGVLNGLGDDIKKGTIYNSNENYKGILAQFPIQFIDVDKEHYADYVGYCAWFNDRNFDFPLYQLVWTDKQSRFPWEEDFFKDWRFKQPLLDRNTDFKFYEERNKGVFTTKAALKGQPIVWVSHYDDGDWLFFTEESPEQADVIIVSLESLVKADPTLNELYYLNFGQYAERESIDSEWEIFDNED